MSIALTIWGELLPQAPTINARDGRRWTYDADELIAAFKAEAIPLALDYEHAQDLLAAKGLQAPAAGWITEMALYDRSLWAKLELTAQAAARVQSLEYRYLSASLRQTSEGRITSIAGAGLVNRPAMVLKALNPAMTTLPVDAIALAHRAEAFRTQQAALGRMMTFSEAVMSVQERQ